MAYEYERDEWRAAVNSYTPTQRIAACGHSNQGTRAICPDCGHDARDEM